MVVLVLHLLYVLNNSRYKNETNQCALEVQIQRLCHL